MLTLEDFKTCVDKLPPDTQVHFSAFGEPQVNPAFADMVLYAHSTGRAIALYSTFVGMTRESYLRIRDVPFKVMVFHIPDSDGNSHFTLSDEYLDLMNLVFSDTAAGRFTIMAYSCHGAMVHPVIAEILKKNGLPVPAGQPFDHLIDRAGNLKEKGLIHLEHPTGRIWCSPTGLDFNHNILLPDGTVVLCCQDFGMQHILGNLLTQSYDEIMGGEEIQKLRRCMKSQKDGDCLCRHCHIAQSDFEYFVKAPLLRRISLIRRKVGLRTRIRRLIKKSTRST